MTARFALEKGERGWILLELEFIEDTTDNEVILKDVAERYPKEVIPAGLRVEYNK